MSIFNRLFKFRIFKFRTTLAEELEDLHNELTNLQQNLTQTRLRQRQWIKWFAIYAITIYLMMNTLYYVLLFPEDFFTQICAFSISIALAFLFYVIHWIIRWYFRSNIRTKEEKIGLFKERKQELIEEVKNKETYAVAQNLLERYGEKLTPEVRSPIINSNNTELRQRTSMKPNVTGAEKSNVSITSPTTGACENNNRQIQTPVRGGSTRVAAGITPGKLPRAVLPPQRTLWGAILDTLVGDGPSKRYALICKSCKSHNGMALDDEFEYLPFRCAYCNYFNSARKHKPVFKPDLVSPNQTQNGANTKQMELPATDSSEPINGNRITRRSINMPITNNNNDIRSHSILKDNTEGPNRAFSSSEESSSENK